MLYVSIKSKYKRLTSRDFMFSIFSLSIYDSAWQSFSESALDWFDLSTGSPQVTKHKNNIPVGAEHTFWKL